MQYFIL